MLPDLIICLPRRVESSLGSEVVCRRLQLGIVGLRHLEDSVALEALEVVVETRLLTNSRRIPWLRLARDWDGLRRLLGRVRRLLTTHIFSRLQSRYVSHIGFWMLCAKLTTVSQLAESDFAAQARLQAANWGQNLQTGARGAADQFNRFVEGEEGHAGGQRSRVEPERRDFWDDFSTIASQEQQAAGHRRGASRSDVVGTAAMRKTPATGSSLANSSTSNAETTTAPSGLEGTESGATSTAKGKDDWDDNW